jgi:hypothetical protein
MNRAERIEKNNEQMLADFQRRRPDLFFWALWINGMFKMSEAWFQACQFPTFPSPRR